MIINALHASPSGTQITVSSRYLPPLGEFSGAVEIDFSDQGTGLGLSVSYGIIKEHGGEIKVKSKPGVGTTFSVIIPLEKKAAPVDKR
jgi:signal transduction histidine kinase